MKTMVKKGIGISGLEISLNLKNIWELQMLQDRLESILAENNNGAYSAEIPLEEVMRANSFLWNILQGIPPIEGEDDIFRPHALRGARDLTPHHEEEESIE